MRVGVELRGHRLPRLPAIQAGSARLISFGHIALQAEGQPVWFRNIEPMSLEEP